MQPRFFIGFAITIHIYQNLLMHILVQNLEKIASVIFFNSVSGLTSEQTI
jgi:hypothetical protein